MNFVEAYKQGQAGKNKGLTTGISTLDEAMDGIQRKSIYTIGGAPKSGKTTLVDYAFVISPYLENAKRQQPKNIRWKYFSYEIDRIRKEFKYAAFFMYHDFGINVFQYNGKYYDMSSRYLLGKLMDENKNLIPVSADHEAKLKIIYEHRIIPLFGEYDEFGKKIKNGAIDFIVETDNPTGIRNFLINDAMENGEFVKEKYKIRDNGQILEKERIVGYKSNDPDEYVIIITDHRVCGFKE